MAPDGGALVLWSSESAGLEGWSTNAAPGCAGRLAVEDGPEGAALRFDFELAGPTGWVIARRELDAVLPRHWVAVVRLRGAAPPNDLQVKLVDPAGANVWWWRRRDFTLPRESSRVVLRRAALEFAWGPAGGGEPGLLGAVEVAVAAGLAGSGILWIDDLRIEPREPAADPPRPRGVRASSSAPGHDPSGMLDEDPGTYWQPAAEDGRPWVEVDLGRVREWGGLEVDWTDVADAPPSRLLASADGVSWTALVEDAGGGRVPRWLRTGDAESRFARLELDLPVGIRRLRVVPIELAVAPARWAAARAASAPRGCFPRHLLGEQAAWAVVGVDGDERKGLLGEDGALEVDAEGFTLEPFLWTGGRLLTWADVEPPRMGLADGCLPIPWTEWTAADVCLRVTAFAIGEPGRSALVAEYTVANRRDAPRDARLVVAIRPFQVTPAWQSLNLVGGVAPIARLEWTDRRVRVDGRRDVIAVTAPDGFGAARAEEGLSAVFDGRLPVHARAEDALGFAEGALAFDLRLPPGARDSVVLVVPLFDTTPPPPGDLSRAAAAAWGAARLEDAITGWRARLGAIPIALPPCAAPFEQTLRASVAWILVNRDGPRIQPGPRTYRRSWIRDGALTAATLAEMGFAEEARAFLGWYAPHQHADGRVPCAVDRRGVDPTAEHDSHGELAWGVVEVFRLTGDEAFLRALWPHVRRAADAIAVLRAERTTDAFRDGPCFGLLPESISHEGYASSPVHSYWDDFFAVCGLASAAEAADVLGEAEAAARFGGLRDAMRRDLHASIARTRARHAIDFLPGSVELGDFDPTSTAIALDPCAEGGRLPRAALERTFARYWEELEARRTGELVREAYTPYEVRNATALLVLGWKTRALVLLEWLIDDQRPPAWRQWPEVAHRDPRAPRFLGDLPHGWVASSFVRAVRRLLARERDDDGALVVAEGVPETWVREPPGVRVTGLPTRYGALDLALWAEGADRVHVAVGGSVRPPGGIVLVSPLGRPLRRVAVDGRGSPPEDPRHVRIGEPPASVVLWY